MLITSAASAFGWLMAVAEVPLRMSEALLSISENPLVLLIIVNLILLVLGTFMDMAPLIIITTPIFLPVATQLGMDPVQFGVVLILNLRIGLVTPLVGAVLFVGCAGGGRGDAARRRPLPVLGADDVSDPGRQLAGPRAAQSA